MLHSGRLGLGRCACCTDASTTLRCSSQTSTALSAHTRLLTPTTPPPPPPPPADAYTALALFNLLRFPLAFLPFLITMIVNAMIALRRIEAFLIKGESRCVGAVGL